jgi:hypothetical protein
VDVLYCVLLKEKTNTGLTFIWPNHVFVCVLTVAIVCTFVQATGKINRSGVCVGTTERRTEFYFS